MATSNAELQAEINRIMRMAAYISPSSSGGAWGHFGTQGMVNQIGQRLRNVTGVDDINDLELATKDVPVTFQVEKLYDYDTGKEIYKKVLYGGGGEGDFYTELLTPEEAKNVKTELFYDNDNGAYYEKYSLDSTVKQRGIYNKKTGQLLASENRSPYAGMFYGGGKPTVELGGWGEGEGMTYANLTFDANGKPVIETWGKNTSSVGDILPILSIALMAIPGIGQAVGSALLPTGVSTAVATAVGNAVVNAGLQVASGVPVEKAILNSAASLGVSQLVPNLSGNVYVDNAIKSVATAALTGGDVGNALANSLIATGGNELLGNATFTGDKVVDSAIASAITSGVQAAATDGDVGASAIKGALAGASGQLTKEEKMAESAKSGAGFIGEDVTAPINVAGAAGNDSIPAGVGVDTIGGIAGADTVNSGVAENDVLDLIQRDINTSVANNVQGNLNAEQEIQSATPVEPGTSDFTIPGGTTVGEFAEPGTAGFSRNPVTTGVATTGTTGTTAAQDTPYVAPNGMHNRAAFIAAGGGTSDADYAKYVQAVNAVISEGKSGTLIKPSSVNSAGKQLPSTTGPVTTEAPRVDSVLGSIAAQGVASFGKNTIGGALSALGFTDAGNAAINKANAIAETATVAEGPEITVGKQYIDQAIRNVTNSNSAREAFVNLGNLVSTIYDNPKAFGAVVGSEIVEEILQIGSTKAGSFLTRELIASAVENGGAAYNNEYEKQIRLGAPPDVAHESAQLAAGTAAGATAALGLSVAGAGKLLASRTGTTSLAGTFAKETAQEALEAGTVASTVDLALTGSIDVRNALTEALNDAVYSGTISSSMQAGSNVVSLPTSTPLTPVSTPTPSGSGVVVAVDPNTNQASVIDNGGNITIIPAEDLTPGQNIALPSTPVDTSPVVDQPVVDQPVVTEPVVTEPVVTEPPIAQPVITQPVVTTPPVLTPEQIAAQELDAEILKILRMAVKKDPVDMRYDLNKDGRVNVIDALALQRGQATVPTVEEYQASLAQQTVAPQPEIAEPPITQPAVTEPVTQEPLTQDIVTTAPSTTPFVTQPVEQTPSVEPPSPPPIVEPTPPTSEVTGIVLQNNGDGTALVLTNDGNAANVPVTDAVSNEPLTPGSSVTIDQNTNTATVTPPASDGGAQAPIVSAPPAVQDTGGDQQVLGGGQQPTTDAGSIIDTPIGTDISTPAVTPGLDVNVNPNVNVDEPIPPVDELPLVDEFPPVEDRLPPLPPPVKTEEDLLLEQIIRELEPTPPVSEGVPIPEPEFPEPPLVLPESPTINVADRLTVRPVVDRGYRRPSVSPGSRVEESAQILPIRPGLSEGGTGGIEGTTEQEQEPVWNVRSLKLRRLLGI